MTLRHRPMHRYVSFKILLRYTLAQERAEMWLLILGAAADLFVLKYTQIGK